MEGIVEFLLSVAQGCMALARDCPHQETSRGLQAVGAQLMLKAEELQQLYGK